MMGKSYDCMDFNIYIRGYEFKCKRFINKDNQSEDCFFVCYSPCEDYKLTSPMFESPYALVAEAISQRLGNELPAMAGDMKIFIYDPSETTLPKYILIELSKNYDRDDENGKSFEFDGMKFGKKDINMITDILGLTMEDLDFK